MIGELVITRSMLGLPGETIEDKQEISSQEIEKLRHGLMQLERNTRELQENIMQVRMMPFSFTLPRFPRPVRDLSSQSGKKIDLKLSGKTTAPTIAQDEQSSVVWGMPGEAVKRGHADEVLPLKQIAGRILYDASHHQ